MTDPSDDIPDPGLRARKKAQTRTAISDVATRLFVERGFDAVTVAEVAEAAGVSIKTVFNYFGSKEELFLDRDAAIRDLVAETVVRRAAGQTPTGALGALMRANCILDLPGWEVVGGPRRDDFRAFLATWEAAPALQARQLTGNERLAGALAALLRAECPDASPHAVDAFAAALVAALHLRQRAIVDGVLGGDPPDAIRDTARAIAAETMTRAARAFPDLDRPASVAGAEGGDAGD
jgi:AcrR family transcriptional regulator